MTETVSPYLNHILQKVQQSPDKITQDNLVFWNELVRRLGLKPGQQILEIGSCIGRMGQALAKWDIQTIGVDKDLKALQEGQKLGFYAKDKSLALAANGFTLPFANKSFDTLVSWDLLEHIPKDELPALLHEFERVLKDEGKMYHRITTTEDKRIETDPTHVTKQSQQEWENWFLKHHWQKINSAETIGLKRKKIKLFGHLIARPTLPTVSFGHFILKRAES